MDRDTRNSWLIAGVVFLFIAIIIIALMVTNAFAQQNCGPRDLIARGLARPPWLESRAFMATADGGKSLVEIFVSASGTWSFLVSRADGMGCILNSGQNWTATSEPEGDPS